MSHIGSAAIRSDAWSKVTGETVYTYDYKEVGMLYGYLLRSRVAAGKLVRLDLGTARTMPGVRAVPRSRRTSLPAATRELSR